MARLRGVGMGTGMALGTAAIVRMHGGIPLRPEPPERLATLIALNRVTETPEVILVAEDYRTALVIAETLGWAKVVGIAAAGEAADAPVSNIPAVVAVPDLMNSVEDEMLMLVDAGRGIVLADPDPVYVLQYQSEVAHIAPRRRLFLDDAHQPAITLDGRKVQVVATAANAEAVAASLEAGADALYLTVDLPLTEEAETEDTAVRDALFSLIDLAAGKPLLLLGDFSLPSVTLLEAANRADLIVVLPLRPTMVGLGFAELTEAFAEAETECIANDIAYSKPLLAADLTASFEPAVSEPDASWVETLAANGVARLLLSVAYDALADALPQSEPIFAAAAEHLLPVIVHLTAFLPDAESLREAVSAMVALGAAGVLVEPDEVAAVKIWIRELNASEAREALFEMSSFGK